MPVQQPAIYETALRYREGLRKGNNAAVNRLINAYKNLYGELKILLRGVEADILAAQQAGQTATPDWLRRRDRYQQLMAQTLQQMQKFGAITEHEIEQLVSSAFAAAQKDAFALTAAQLPAIPAARLRPVWNTLPTEALETVIGFTGQKSPWRRALNKAGYSAQAAAIAQGFEKAVGLGLSPRELAAEFTRLLGMPLADALRLSRTTQINAYREASRLAYEANERLVPTWTWVSSLDPAGTCMACVAMHGSTHPVTERLNDHHNGWCVMVPNPVSYRELGLDIDGPPVRKIPTGEEWFKSLSPAQQRPFMPSRAAWRAWEDGQLKVADFLTQHGDEVWGDLVNVKSLKGILGDEAGKYYGGSGNGSGPKPPAPAPKPEPPPEPKAPPLFPDAKDLGRLELVRGLGGSTGAELVRNPDTGQLYVRKRGGSPEHIREECLADTAYRALGVNVPEFQLYEADGGPVKLARYIEGTTSLGDLVRGGDQAKILAAFGELKSGFVADALLGNWDVLGLDFDNILIDADGQVWRIDNGGGLRFRAQGRPKGTDFDQWVTELWTLRDPRINSKTGQVFGDLEWWDVLDQLEGATARRQGLLDAMPDDLRDLMGRRLDTLADVLHIGRTFQADQWQGGYTDGFSKHSVYLRRAGLLGKLPKSLTQRGVSVYDEKGREWDALRGRDSAIHWLANYMTQHGADQSVVAYWAGRQAGTSWSGASQALKYYIANNRGLDIDTGYFWMGGAEKARYHYEGAVAKIGKEKLDLSYQIWHAFNFELLRNVEFARNNRAAGVVELMRTEPDSVVRRYGLKARETGQLLRGACESGSVFRTVTVAGHHLTLQRVPHHRFMGIYFYERSPGANQGPFLGDGENEFVFIPEGLEVYYYGPVSSGEDHDKFWGYYR